MKEPKKKKRYPDPEERLAEMLALFNYYESFRAQYDVKAETYYHLYTGYVEPLDPDDDRSNLHIPLPYEAVDTWRARLLTTFWGNQRPYVNCLPLPYGTKTREMLIRNIGKGELAAALLDQQYERNMIVPLMYNHYTALLTFPFVAQGVDWKYEEKTVKRRKLVRYPGDAAGFVDRMVMEIEERTEIVYDDNRILPIDYDDFWPDPYGWDIDTFRGVFHREYVTRHELEQLMDVLSDIVKMLGNGKVYTPNYDLEQNVLDFGRSDFTHTSFYGEVINFENGYEYGSPYSLFELLHYWTDDEHIIIFNRQQIIFDGPNHYWRHGKKPFTYASFDPLPGRAIGMSAVQLIEHLSAEINTQRNQRIDLISMFLNPMFEVAGDVDESELIWRRAGIIHVDQIGRQVKAMELSGNVSAAFNETQDTKGEAYNTLAVPDVVRGVQSVRRETATYTAAQNTNASIRFDVKLKLHDKLSHNRLSMLMDCNSQQFINSSRLVRQNWDINTVEAWSIIEPWEIQGEWDYRPAGTATDPAANKEIKVQRLGEFIVQSLNNPYVKMGALTKRFVELSDITSDPLEFVYTEEEVRQMQADAAQADEAKQAALLERQNQQMQSQQQFQVNQQMIQVIADVVKQVISAELKGGETNGRRKSSEKKVTKKKA